MGLDISAYRQLRADPDAEMSDGYRLRHGAAMSRDDLIEAVARHIAREAGLDPDHCYGGEMPAWMRYTFEATAALDALLSPEVMGPAVERAGLALMTLDQGDNAEFYRRWALPALRAALCAPEHVGER